MKYALIVDDNREFADSLCKILSLFDIKAETVYGPWSAIMSVKDRIPSMVFLDINMPGVDGFEVLTYLKREPRLSLTPVFIVSSERQKENIARSIREGAAGFIAKPVSIEELEKLLRKEKLIP